MSWHTGARSPDFTSLCIPADGYDNLDYEGPSQLKQIEEQHIIHFILTSQMSVNKYGGLLLNTCVASCS